MKFNTAVNEMAAEVSGSGTTERIKFYIDKKEMDPGSVRTKMPNAFKAIHKAINAAKKQGLDLSPNVPPADAVIKGNGDIIITDDKNKQQKRFSLEELGFNIATIEKIKQEIK